MLVYKFCDPGGLEILRSGTMLLTRPRVFNDPFDVSPYLSKASAESMPGTIEEEIRDLVVLSLAENRESLLMWAHYADKHRGFAIGFDKDSRIVDDGLMFRFGIAPMSYSHSRPSAQEFHDLSDEALYFRKSCEWWYEREWRIVTSILPLTRDIESVRSQERFSFPLVAQDVSTVIVGHRAKGLFPELYGLLGQERYRHVSLQLAIPDREHYILNFEEWPRSKWTDPPPALVG